VLDAYWASAVFIFLAELGDKTQLLGIAMAARFSVITVILGILAASFANHFFAVLVGSYLSNFINVNFISIIVAIFFILFGLWTLSAEQLEGEEKKTYFNAFWTVAITFFLAEMGDKTQLTSISLAAKYQSFFSVWLGAVTGMLFSNLVGITIGVVLGRKIPQKTMKIIAATIFICFGFFGLIRDTQGMTGRSILLTAAIIITISVMLFLYSKSKKGR